MKYRQRMKSQSNGLEQSESEDDSFNFNYWSDFIERDFPSRSPGRYVDIAEPSGKVGPEKRKVI